MAGETILVAERENSDYWSKIWDFLEQCPGVTVKGYSMWDMEIYDKSESQNYNLATTILSAMGMLSGAYAMFSGRLLEKIGTKPYILVSLAFALAANLCVIAFLKTASVVLVAAIVITYTFGYAACLSTTYLVYNPSFVKSENAFNANSKSGSALLLGNIILQPVLGAVKDSCGTWSVFVIGAAAAVLGITLLMLFFRSVKKRGTI